MTPPFADVGFEEIEPGTSQTEVTGKPRLAIWTSGKLFVNAVAVETFLDGYDAVSLHAGGDERTIIGLAPGTDGEFPRKLCGDSASASINAKAHLNHLGIDYEDLEETLRFDLEAVEDHDHVVAAADVTEAVDEAVRDEEDTATPPADADGESPEAIADGSGATAHSAGDSPTPGPDTESPDSPAEDSVRETFEEAAEDYVWFNDPDTNQNPKYHRGPCGYVGENHDRVPISEALDEGASPCHACCEDGAPTPEDHNPTVEPPAEEDSETLPFVDAAAHPLEVLQEHDVPERIGITGLLDVVESANSFGTLERSLNLDREQLKATNAALQDLGLAEEGYTLVDEHVRADRIDQIRRLDDRHGGASA